MVLGISFVILCIALFLVCYLMSGTDEKNMRNLYRYPASVEQAVLKDRRLMEDMPARRTTGAVFVSNLVLFTVVLAAIGLASRAVGALGGPADPAMSAGAAGAGAYFALFLELLAVGEVLNLFDLVVVDLIWWRHTTRVRFSRIQDAALYQDVRPHVMSFLRGIVMFACAAALGALVVLRF